MQVRSPVTLSASGTARWRHWTNAVVIERTPQLATRDHIKYTDDPLTEVHVNASNSLGDYVRLSDSGKYVYINLLSHLC